MTGRHREQRKRKGFLVHSILLLLWRAISALIAGRIGQKWFLLCAPVADWFSIAVKGKIICADDARIGREPSPEPVALESTINRYESPFMRLNSKNSQPLQNSWGTSC